MKRPWGVTLPPEISAKNKKEHSNVYRNQINYSVQITNDCVYYVEASRCTVDTEHGIILFYKNDSVQAMFQLENIDSFWRVI